jgi:hypothetical protein
MGVPAKTTWPSSPERNPRENARSSMSVDQRTQRFLVQCLRDRSGNHRLRPGTISENKPVGAPLKDLSKFLDIPSRNCGRRGQCPMPRQLRFHSGLGMLNRLPRRNVKNAEGVQELSPRWRLGGALGIGSKKAGSSEGAKESVERLAIKVAQYSRLTISYEVAGFRPLLRSGPRFNVEYPGFRKASTLG